MIRFLLAVFLLLPTLAFAQSQRNPCYNTNLPNGNQNCVSVGTATPLPVTTTGGSSPAGGESLATSQVSVATTPTQVVAARTGRISLIVTNITGTQPIYCSSATATTGNGQYIPAVAGANLVLSYAGVLNCIAVTSAQTVSITEAY